MPFTVGEMIYQNALACPDDLKGWRMEGQAACSYPRGRLRLENAVERDTERGVHANFLCWCPEVFPDGIAVSWDFRPLSDAGLAMFWCAASGRDSADLYDPALAPRDGDYRQYHHGDINGLHLSYFRRNPGEISFRTCNLRKSYGFHLVAQGADPLPDAAHALPAYRLQVIKVGPRVQFSMNGLVCLRWTDDGETHGPVRGGGRIGFRQMAGLIAEYANLEVDQALWMP